MAHLGKFSAALFGISLAGCAALDGGGGDGSSGAAPGYPGSGTGGAGNPLPGSQMSCFFGEDDPNVPAATIEHVLEVFEGQESVRVRLTLDPNFVDNTYGENSLLWGNRGHTFKDLERSDHAELILTDGNGDVALQFKIDYITADSGAPSGYASFGVGGGDGEMIAGDAGHVLATATSLDRNLNERGYSDYISTSPVTDENFTPDPAAPDWDFRNVYEVWVDYDAFGAAGFGEPTIEYIHASPSKSGKDTVTVDPDPCPPDWECNDPDGCDNEPTDPEDPDCNDPDGCDNEPTDPEDPDCNDPDGCDNEPTDPEDPAECVEHEDCPTGEFCEEGTCWPYVE